MGKEAGPFFTYGSDNGDATVRLKHQEQYEATYLNMELAYREQLVTPLEPEHLRDQLVEDIPRLYADYQTYWDELVRELRQVKSRCAHLYHELRDGAVRGLINPL